MSGMSLLASPIPLARGEDERGQFANEPSIAFTPNVKPGDGYYASSSSEAPHGGQVFWPAGLNGLGQTTEGGLPDGDNVTKFVLAPAFEGSQQGYVFKMGTRGLGYYVDSMQLGGGHSVGEAERLARRQDVPSVIILPQQHLSRSIENPLQGVSTEQQALVILMEMLLRLPACVDVQGQSKSVLKVLRELQMHASRAPSNSWTGPDDKLKFALAQAINWALEQVSLFL